MTEHRGTRTWPFWPDKHCSTALPSVGKTVRSVWSSDLLSILSCFLFLLFLTSINPLFLQSQPYKPLALLTSSQCPLPRGQLALQLSDLSKAEEEFKVGDVLPIRGNTLLKDNRFLVTKHRVGNVNGNLRNVTGERGREREDERGREGG